MRRAQSGISLTELMVASVLIGVSLAAITELVAANTFATTKLTNKVDGQVGISRAIRRISEDVRQARIIGNVNSKDHRNWFPDFDSPTEPFTTPPSGTWPPSPWTPTPFKLGPQTLIIQQPVLYKGSKHPQLSGFPLRLAKDAVAPGIPPYPVEYVDTTVYHLIPDAEVTGQYVLQIARFAGNPSIEDADLKPALSIPQTVLKGIVGPVDPSNPSIGPSIFQYLQAPNGLDTLSTPSSESVNSIRGVSVNIETKVPNSNQGANQEISAVHVETFVKTSRNMRFSNDY